MKRRKQNDTKGLWGSWNSQAQGNSERYGGEQDLEAEHETNIHYSINMITSLQENTVELQKYKFSSQE